MKNFKELYYFTSQCLALDSNPEFREKIISSFLTDTFPFEKFVWLCDKHLMIPAIYIKFLHFDILSFVPTEISNLFRNIYDLNKKRNLEIIQQVDQVNKILKDEDITPVYLKGTGNLLDQLYSDPGERYIGDIDLLVKESDYYKTIDAVIALGYKYEKGGYIGNELPKHFNRLYKHDVPADIEIHRIPVNIPFSKKFSNEMIFANRIISKTRENAYVPSIEHRITHNFIHAQLSNRGHWQKYNSLRDLYDLYLLSDQASLIPLANQIEEKNKFISYIVFTCRIFNLKNSLYPIKNSRAELYCYISNLLLKQTHLHKIYQLFFKLYFFLPKRIMLVTTDKLYRKYIFSRIKSEELMKLFQKP